MGLEPILLAYETNELNLLFDSTFVLYLIYIFRFIFELFNLI